MNIPPVITLPDAASQPAAASATAQTPGKSADPAQGETRTDPGHEQIKKTISELEEQLQPMGISLLFTTYGPRDEEIAVVVTDKTTGKVIREIPSKELQQLHTRMSELIGMIFNGSV